MLDLGIRVLDIRRSSSLKLPIPGTPKMASATVPISCGWVSAGYVLCTSAENSILVTQPQVLWHRQSLCDCPYTYIRSYMHTYIQYIHTCIHTYIYSLHTCMHTYIGEKWHP